MHESLLVDRTGPTEVVLRWARPGAVEAVATDRPGGAPVASLRPPAGATELAVAGDAAARRHYWTVVGDGWTATGAERRVPLDGPMNFRDIGGYPTPRGPVRWGLVFRSDNLAALTEADWAELTRLGLRGIYDLRYPEECDRQPSRHAPDASYACVGVPIGEAGGEATDVLDAMLSGRITELGVDFMVDLYERMIVDHAPEFGRLLTLLAEPDALPAAFHCTAGKDRTGIATGLLLRALGVERELVLDDYELSNIYRARRRVEELRPRLEAAGVDVEKVRPFLSAPRPALAAALDAIDRDFGGVEAYLTGPAGMEPGSLERLRTTLVG